jgi:putative NADH-flavin reductase
MIITVFGANGGIGKLVVMQALEKGYQVKAYVRNPSKITFSHPNLEVIKGALNDYQQIATAVKGADAVISTLGPPLKFTYDGFPILEGHQNIIKAMKANKVARFITLATPSIKFNKDKKSVATVMPGILAGILFPRAKKEIVAIGNEVVSSGLDWTIVRIIAPNDKPATGEAKVSFGDEKISFAISREDIAGFIFKQINSSEYIHSMPIIGS